MQPNHIFFIAITKEKMGILKQNYILDTWFWNLIYSRTLMLYNCNKKVNIFIEINVSKISYKYFEYFILIVFESYYEINLLYLFI